MILGYAGLLLYTADPGGPSHAELNQIVRAAQKAGDLTKQLLAFSRKQVLQLQSVDLNARLAGLEAMLVRLLGADLQVSLRLAPELGRCWADPAQVEQVIVNLAVNARDAMPGGGALVLQTENVTFDAARAAQTGLVAGPYVMLAVKDTGTGIAPALLSRVFEPFFTTKETGKGTGLGLSIVYGIVKQSDGHLEVESSLGEGTTFRLYLPRAGALDANKSLAPERAPTGLDYLGTEGILLVDDQNAVLEATAAILRVLGYQVFEAASPGDALVAFEQHPAAIALLVTDVVMPRMSGTQLAARLLPMQPALKVLYISGHPKGIVFGDPLNDPSRAGYLQKPFLPNDLGKAVRALLDAP